MPSSITIRYPAAIDLHSIFADFHWEGRRFDWRKKIHASGRNDSSQSFGWQNYENRSCDDPSCADLSCGAMRGVAQNCSTLTYYLGAKQFRHLTSIEPELNWNQRKHASGSSVDSGELGRPSRSFWCCSTRRLPFFNVHLFELMEHLWNQL